MRELRVIGLAPDGKHVICVDTQSNGKCRLPVDEKLRAAIRGDIARFGQIEIEMESTLRPKDIQARIRAGASIEQVAAESRMPTTRVERFAYPVLLERARAAELAQKGHPVRANGPAVETLADVVTQAFRARGHDMDHAEWDAWKDETGHWVAQLQWQAGRSMITAHWRFQLDAHGGSVTALDDPARDIIDPDFGRPLRGLTPVAEAPEARAEEPGADAQQTLDEATEPEAVPDEPAAPEAEPESVRSARVAGERPAKAAPTNGSSRDKRGKPAMPSWEDVLLGVRSSGR